MVDEVGYIPFDPEAASLIFGLVSSRYERMSMITPSAAEAVKAARAPDRVICLAASLDQTQK